MAKFLKDGLRALESTMARFSPQTRGVNLNAATVKMMITREDRERLGALDWNSVELKRMKPEQAGVLLTHRVRRPEKLSEFTAQEITKMVEAIVAKEEEEEEEKESHREVEEEVREEGEGEEKGEGSGDQPSQYFEVVIVESSGEETRKGIFKKEEEADLVMDLYSKRQTNGRKVLKRKTAIPID
ncbi:hypothetical protein TrVE_jg6814 [Triparma verrucosa]|uniref:Uncharacterized protein n=1 Tax=Triparma verrucosa TaxID=1606542 RepID=A0A9W7BBC6_9STRA|nr:hypothetical protein TrVE_jg6814 [Triparma verrucosa]